MKCLHLICTRSLFLSILLMFTVTASAIDFGDIPKNLLAPAGWLDDQWTDPGNWTVVDVTKHGLKPNDPSINASAKVSQIVGSGSAYRILYFPPGEYWFTTNLTIKKNGIRLQGAGAGLTKFYQKNAKFTFSSTSTGNVTVEMNDPAPRRGAKTVSTPYASSLKPGDFILPVAQFPWGGRLDSYRSKMSRFGIGQIVRVTSVNGNEVRFDHALGLDYKPYPQRRIRILKMQKDIGIEGVHIEKLSNDDKPTIFFDHVQNGFVRNCRLYYTSKQHIEVKDGYRVFIESNNIQQSHDKGEGGHGYGIRFLNNSTRCYAVNNKLQQLRHAIVLQVGANHCVIAYNHAQSNLLLHGNYSHNNLFEGNDAAAGINFDSVHGANGPYNFVYRNRAIHSTKGIGKLNGADPNIVIGNVTNNFDVETTDFVGANRISGSIKWGVYNSGSIIPGSLYLSSAPYFLKGFNLPAFGPDTDSSWGLNRKLPATVRSITSVPPLDESEQPDPDPQNQAPSCTITSPQNGTTLNADEVFSVLVNARDSDGQVKKVDLFINGTYYATDTTASYQFEIDGLNAGNYSIFARAYDNDGAQSQSAKVNISVEAPAPTDPGNGDLKLAFASPNAGDVLAEGSDLYVKVTAPDESSIQNIKLYINGEFVRRENKAPYEWGKASQSDTLLANMAAGEYQLEALALTSNGESISQTISIKVQKDGASGPVSVPSDVYSAGAFVSSNNINKNGHVKANSWLGYDVSFGIGNDTVKFKVSSGRDGGTIECRLGSKDGKVIGRAYVPPTGGWANYIDIYCYVGDLSGSDKIFFTFDGGLKTLLDIEEFSFVSSSSVSGKLEAEEAVLSDANIESALSGFSGSGYAVFKANSFAGWSPLVSKAGKYTLTFNYSLLSENAELDLLENDKFIPSSMLFTEENNWGSFSVDVDLKAGENTVILTNGTSTTIKIDLMTIRK